MEIVFKAAELHPLNYYAWNYARWLTCYSSSSTPQLLKPVYAFCKSHVGDTSAWSFLAFLLERQSQDVRLEYLKLVLGYAQIVPGHEALWSFVRVIVGQYFLLDATGVNLVKTVTADQEFVTSTLKFLACQ